MDIISVENLSLKNGSKYIIKELNWSIQPGEKWVLFGLNGCGKTTLLSILAGYKTGSEGKNFIFGQNVNEENFIDLRKKIGFVSSSFFDQYLNREIVLDIVLAGKYGTLGFQEDEPSSRDIRKANSILKKFGLEKRSRYPYDTLSKGQQQCVLIARALMSDPEVLVLDEPCSGLDVFSREKFLHMIETLSEERVLSIVYVTHHTEEILPFFNKAALMKNGTFFAKGDLQDVFSEEILTNFLETKATVLWTEQHFFINLDFSEKYQSKYKFLRNTDLEEK